MDQSVQVDPPPHCSVGSERANSCTDETEADTHLMGNEVFHFNPLGSVLWPAPTKTGGANFLVC